MRMNQTDGPTAADLLNTYSAAKLQEVFSKYGEVRNAKTLALRIVEFRQNRKYKSIGDLLSVIEPVIRGQPTSLPGSGFSSITH